MMRTITQAPPEVKLGESDAESLIQLAIELLTPIFGGGARSRQIDEVCWLRSSAVKGQLRFWWRALFGHQFESPKRMWEAESMIFGSAATLTKGSGPGMIKIHTCAQPISKSSWFPESPNKPEMTTYFPGRQEAKNNTSQAVLGDEKSIAYLEINMNGLGDAIKKQVRDALVAWILFGGAGSRTRASAGQIALKNKEDAGKIGYPENINGLKIWIEKSQKITKNFGLKEFFSFSNKSSLWMKNSSNSDFKDWLETAMSDWKDVRKNFKSSNPDNRALLGMPFADFRSERYASPIWKSLARIWHDNGSSKTVILFLVTCPHKNAFGNNIPNKIDSTHTLIEDTLKKKSFTKLA